jgi:phage terminase large subunit-like protein
MSYLVEYYGQCRDGHIIIGRELMQQLNMLIGDMDGKEYRFDPAEAHKRIKFIESQCKHSKSPFAKKPFILELWEKAFMEAAYGFYIEIDGAWFRRFTYATLLVGRKNGKSTFAAGLANAEFYCGPWGCNIMLGSNDYEQAGILFDESNNMREESPELDKTSRKNQTGIFMGNPKQRKKRGKFSSQNKAHIKKISAKGTGGKEGRNLDFAVIDETHEAPDDRLIMPIVQSTSSKDESLIIEISTEGFVQDGHLEKHLKTCRQILRGELLQPRHLVWLYTQDSEEEIWRDRKSWQKSNPNLGVSKKWRYLDDLIEQAKTDNETRAFMLAKDFNRKQNAAVAWLNPAAILNPDTFTLEDLRGCYYVGGNDFAETTDLCASTLIFYVAGKKYNYTHYWITQNKLAASNYAEKHEDGAEYMQWVKDGHVTVVESSDIDTAIIADWQWQLHLDYGLIPYRVGYDNRFASSYKAKYKEYFGDGWLQNIPQTTAMLHNPMKALEYELKNKEHNYGNNPVTYWCLCNMGFRMDSRGFMQPCKISRDKRIDGGAATVTAMAVYRDCSIQYERLNVA